MATTLVTGATGFVGSHLVPRLRRAGRSVRCLVRPSTSHTFRLQELGELGAEVVFGDVTEPDSLQQGDFEGVDEVIHLVAIIRQKGQATYEKVNYRGTVNIVEAAKKAGVKRFIYMSALGVMSDRRFPYLYTKWQGEEAVVNSGLAYSIFKPSTQFGEGDEFFNKLAIAVKMGPIVPIAGTGRTKFQPIWVEDTITGILKALDDDSTMGKTYEIGGPEHLTYEEMMDIVIETLGVKRAKLHLPVLMIYPVAAVMDNLMPNPLVTPRQLDLLALDNITDLDSVERHFGFKPKPLRGGIDYIRDEAKLSMLF